MSPWKRPWCNSNKKGAGLENVVSVRMSVIRNATVI